jgi:hypothetical protein
MRLFFLTFAIALIISCSSEDSDVPTVNSLSSTKSIITFSINSTSGTINASTKSITLKLPIGTAIDNLAPFITISSKATISPASGTTQNFSNPVSYFVTAEDESTNEYKVTINLNSCVSTSSIYSFTYNGEKYEIAKETKTWAQAAACAAERGGYLLEINDSAEQGAIFDELINNTSITNSNTISPDGGEASYVWLGGNDIKTEGSWIWDGNNDKDGDTFWVGDVSGSAVGGVYSNWGNEPDDFGSGQDALGLALTDWPRGKAGEWNDLTDNNELYFVIELD